MSGRSLFVDDEDHDHYQRLLAREVVARGWTLFTWCHMPNHVHLLLRTERPDLGRGIKAAHERFATHLNDRYGRHGHVFGDRFANRLVTRDAHLVACLRYIARNPVTAGLCAEAGQWRWSAHRALLGQEPAPAFLAVGEALAWLDDRAAAARGQYAELVAAGDRDLVTRLRSACRDDAWLVAALDVHRLPATFLADVLGVSATSVYRRARAARASLIAREGTVP